MTNLAELFSLPDAIVRREPSLPPKGRASIANLDASNVNQVIETKHLGSNSPYAFEPVLRIGSLKTPALLDINRANARYERVIINTMRAPSFPALRDTPEYLGVDHSNWASDAIHSDGDGWTHALAAGTFANERHDPHYASIEAQVVELRVDAIAEGQPYDQQSADNALAFCHFVAADHEPAVFLLANGNLRAVWQNARRDEIGVQFFPDGMLQYVILHDRGGKTLKSLGETVDRERVIGALRVEELTGLWYDG